MFSWAYQALLQPRRRCGDIVGLATSELAQDVHTFLPHARSVWVGSARYCEGFPTIRCNIDRLSDSIDSLRSRLFPSIPAKS